MQKAKQNYFKDRSVYYSTFPIQQQAIKGDWDFKLKAVYCIGILDFVFSDDSESTDVIHTAELKDQHNQVFYDKLKFIYVEMPRFNKSLDQLDNHQERWLYFIKNLADLQDIPNLFKGDIISKGFETARIAALNSNERLRYETSLKEYRDLYSVVKTAKQEGFDEGEIKGKVKGKIEGKIEGAKNLIKLQVLTDQQIADTMELKLEQVKQLKETFDNDNQ